MVLYVELYIKNTHPINGGAKKQSVGWMDENGNIKTEANDMMEIRKETILWNTEQEDSFEQNPSKNPV